MAGRLDLEARLQALRANKRSSGSPPASAPSPPPVLRSTDALAWPSVPTSPVRTAPTRVATPVAVGTDSDGWPRAPPRRSSMSVSTAPPVVVMRRASSESVGSPAEAAMTVATPPPSYEQQQPTSAPDQEMMRLTAAQLLGPQYEEAVRVAQYAIESERRQLAHTAIDAYIRAGQMLIEIGRRQAAPHLQEIVKKKALALLQRAEGLSEWTSRVLAATPEDSKQALAAAYHESAQHRDASLTQKRELVSKMQADNQTLKTRLNQLVLLTKIRGRFRRVISDRRERKAAEARAKALEAAQDTSGPANDVTGDSEGEEDDAKESEEDDNGQETRLQLLAQHKGESPREEEKVQLINELHSQIGLPEIDHLRKFQPLAEDPSGDSKQEELQSELEAAKDEAENLRAAVQEMEDCLRLAAQHSKKHSMKIEREKQEEFAKVQNELERVREELELERRRSASLHGSSSSWRSPTPSNPDVEEFEDTGVMHQLRSSLHKLVHARDSPPTSVGYASGADYSPVQRTSYSHDSPRHKQQQPLARADSVEEEDDGGLWV